MAVFEYIYPDKSTSGSTGLQRVSQSSYGIGDSLKAIQQESQDQANYLYGGNNESSPYSFLTQYASGNNTSGGGSTLTNPYSQGATSSGGLSRSSTGGYSNYPTISIPTLEEIDVPTLNSPDIPVYTAPERDETRRSELQTKAAAPGLTRLRRGLDQGIQSTRSIDNPTERKYQLSGMLEEYGLNLGDIISKADMTGLQEYETEFSTQLDQAKTRYSADVQGALTDTSVANQNLMLQYQQDLADRNAKYALEAEAFGSQGIQKQAEALSGSDSGGMVIGKPYITGNKANRWLGYNIQ